MEGRQVKHTAFTAETAPTSWTNSTRNNANNAFTPADENKQHTWQQTAHVCTVRLTSAWNDRRSPLPARSMTNSRIGDGRGRRSGMPNSAYMRARTVASAAALPWS